MQTPMRPGVVWPFGCKSIPIIISEAEVGLLCGERERQFVLVHQPLLPSLALANKRVVFVHPLPKYIPSPNCVMAIVSYILFLLTLFSFCLPKIQLYPSRAYCFPKTQVYPSYTVFQRSNSNNNNNKISLR